MGPLEANPLDSFDAPPTVESSAGGKFEITVPAGQTATLAFFAPGYRLDVMSVPAEDDDVVLSLTPRGMDSRIELVTEDGRPVRGQDWTLSRNGWRIPEVVLWDYLGKSGCATPATDSDGSVLFGGCLSAGSYRFLIKVWKPIMDIPSEPVEFPAPPVVRLRVFTKEMPRK